MGHLESSRWILPSLDPGSRLHLDARDQVAASCAKARVEPLPAALKAERPGAVQLPPANVEGDLTSALLTRRTWRCFGHEAIAFGRLATLSSAHLGRPWLDPSARRWQIRAQDVTFGRSAPQHRSLCSRAQGHGLRRGLYHYHPDTHRLGWSAAARAAFRTILPGQPWYDDASAVLLMTAVFERVQWRYPYARAYRAVLAESGHLCQTFCLVATSLGLAPFCTMALADSRIERDLKIDGVSESVIYAAGVGARPKGVDWAPWPGSNQTPCSTSSSRRRASFAAPPAADPPDSTAALVRNRQQFTTGCLRAPARQVECT